MNSVNLYILCGGTKLSNFILYKKSLISANDKKREKRDEMDTLVCLVKDLLQNGVDISHLDSFFWGFSIPQISKEFDLLKIYENGAIINIELKIQEIELGKIEYQLKKNQYYLSHLKKEIYSFTYVKNNNCRKVYFYNGDKICEANIKDIISVIASTEPCIEKNIEKLFKAKEYLISPINTPELFVSGNYYLTGRQEEIKNKIIKGIHNGEQVLWGIQGGAGTGKTLLLYDIAKTLGKDMRVCIIHSGILAEGHRLLNSRLSSLDIIAVKECCKEKIELYDCILVDEAQRLYQYDFNCLIESFKLRQISCVFAYDYFQVLSKAESIRNIPQQLRECNFFVENKLSDKIRTNKEVVSFITNVLNLSKRPRGYMNYENIEILYAKNYSVARRIVSHYVSNRGYQFISYTPSRIKVNEIDNFGGYINTHHVIGQEFDNVIFSMDNNFRYDEEGRLQGKIHPNPDYIFYKLWFQGVSRAREKLCLLIIGNEELFNEILKIKMQFVE